MRTDVKIGVTTVLVVSVAVLLYFVLNSGRPEDSETTQDDISPATPFNQPVQQDRRPLIPTINPPAAQVEVDAEDDVVIISNDTGAADEEIVKLPPPPPVLDVNVPERREIPSIPVIEEPAREVSPSPTPPAITPTSTDPQHGDIFTDRDGKRYYVVKKGDNGLWAVAEIVYGDGRKWHVLAGANQEAARGLLRPGQRIFLPEIEDEPAASMPPTRRIADSVPEGSRIYVIKSGDLGYEMIARREYGVPSLWPAIARANPNVDSNRLRIGQEIILPSIEEARRLLGVTESQTPPASTSTSSQEAPSTPSPAPAVPQAWD